MYNDRTKNPYIYRGILLLFLLLLLPDWNCRFHPKNKTSLFTLFGAILTTALLWCNLGELCSDDIQILVDLCLVRFIYFGKCEQSHPRWKQNNVLIVMFILYYLENKTIKSQLSALLKFFKEFWKHTGIF